ncbi:pyruvate kinase [Acidihalobacter prosperus]|uniref:pyruvate kinase n=1 Tax=Acidihalobacter prosperus TaxID=160660 RepID=A0A1A6C0A3_9GAMM|nr:pyruvate kinase [Acidihalobacter prosperus]OBS07988.1 hypothetical protein Thpro_022238 [Acidihalobacter prosperus]
MANADRLDWDDPAAVLGAVSRLRTEVVGEGDDYLRAHGQMLDGTQARSALNLAHYLALRRHDLRPLQARLADLGLSSLGRSEGHVRATLDAVLAVLQCLAGTPVRAEAEPAAVGADEARALLESRTQALFGAPPAARGTRIMVTLPSVAADDPAMIGTLLAEGMDCARINCAHDDAGVWARMIANVRQAAAAAGRDCPVLMDLAGRKPRTGPLALAPSVAHLKPRRDGLGRPVGPADVLLIAPETNVPAGLDAAYRFGIDAALAAQLQVGDRLGFDDTRGKRRELLVVDVPTPGVWLAQVFQSAWLTPETPLQLLRRSQGGHLRAGDGEYRLHGFAPRSLRIRLRVGETLLLAGDAAPGEPARFDANGRCLRPARIGCVECGSLTGIAVGDPIWIDDGRVGAEVIERRADGRLLRITHAPVGGVLLKEGRGLNFPRSRRDRPALTDKDLADLDFVARHADMVGLSFVETPADLDRLFAELRTREAGHIGVIAKIESAHAVQALPQLLFAALGHAAFGLMIARGDLAVEIGGERLSEIQEEILWLAEAAHLPVVWATQVLETLAKQGAVSRPELSDAVLGQRAECVMLNKGPHILAALQTLDDVLRRTGQRQYKHSPRLRALSIAGRNA